MTKTLPFEILKQIFSHLEFSYDLLQCILTCQEWKKPAVEALYETIYLDDFNDDSADCLMDSISYHSMDVANMVKVINLREVIEVCLEDSERCLVILDTIFDYCPNIKSILCDFAHLYEERFWVLIFNAVTKTGLKKLEAIPSVRTSKSLESYYLPVVQEIKDRLKHFIIDSTIMTTSNNLKDMSSTFIDLFSKTDFPKLEGIAFATANNVLLMNCESIINRCTEYNNFKALTLGINLDIDQNISYENCCHLISNVPTTDDIKVLHYQHKKLSDFNMLYTMHKFPKLEILSLSTRLSMPSVTSTIPSKIVTEQVIYQFFEFVSKVPKLENSSIMFNKHSNHNYRLLLVLLLKRDDMKEIEVDYTCETYSPAKIDFGRKNNRRHEIEIEAGVDDGFVFSCLKEYSHKIRSLSLQSMKLFQQPTSNLIDEDHSHPLTSPIMSKGDLYSLTNGLWFEYAVSCCSALKNLTIKSPGSNIKMSDNLNDLEQNDSVERLTIQYFNLSQYNSNVFPKISKCLSSLKFLTFIDCGTDDDDLEDDDDEFRNTVIKIDLPYTSFQTFTWFYELFSPRSKGAYYCTTTHSIFYLKITLVGSSERCFYYKLDRDKITSLSSEDSYQEVINTDHDEATLFIEISCVKIAQFLRLFLENYSDHTFDLNLF